MFDHSNCGIGAIANLDGTYSHNIIEQGMTLLKALSHRGGTSKDGTGDGCGILLQIPTSFYEKRYGIQGDFAVMMTFLPKGEKRAKAHSQCYNQPCKLVQTLPKSKRQFQNIPPEKFLRPPR